MLHQMCYTGRVHMVESISGPPDVLGRVHTPDVLLLVESICSPRLLVESI